MGSVRRAPRSRRWEARWRDPSGRHRTKTFDARATRVRGYRKSRRTCAAAPTSTVPAGASCSPNGPTGGERPR
jgi:hypothetical protein